MEIILSLNNLSKIDNKYFNYAIIGSCTGFVASIVT